MFNKDRYLSFFLPSLQDVLFIALFIGVIGLGPRLLNVDGDLGRHLTIGEYILQGKSIPTRDIFSHTLAGGSLTPHEWLAQVAYALFYRLSGLDGVVLLCALLIALTFSLVFRQSCRRSRLLTPALLLAAIAAGAASLHWLARPHLFTLLLVAIWTGELEQVRRGAGPRWWFFPVLMFFWVNLHGAFIAGFVILGAYVAGEAIEKKDWRIQGKPLRIMLLAGITSLAVTFINPAGAHLWGTSLGYVQNRYLVDHTAEYLPPNFHDSSTWPFLGMLVLMLFLLGLRWQTKADLPASAGAGQNPKAGRLSLADLFLLTGWTALSLYSVRNVPLFAVVAAPILCEVIGAFISQHPALAGWQQFDLRLQAVERRLSGRLWPVVVVGLVGLTLIAGAGKGPSADRFDAQVFPVTAVDWLAVHPHAGKMFNYFPWGGYLLYRLWPDQRVFIDGQTDFYGEALTRQYEQVITVQTGWQAVLEGYQVDWVIMPPESALIRALAIEPGWHELYRDDTAAIWALSK